MHASGIRNHTDCSYVGAAKSLRSSTITAPTLSFPFPLHDSSFSKCRLVQNTFFKYFLHNPLEMPVSSTLKRKEVNQTKRMR